MSLLTQKILEGITTGKGLYERAVFNSYSTTNYIDTVGGSEFQGLLTHKWIPLNWQNNASTAGIGGTTVLPNIKETINIGANVINDNYRGIVTGVNNSIYLIPHADKNGIIAFRQGSTSGIKSWFGANVNTTPSTLWAGGVCARNGRIYCVPHDTEQVLVINTVTEINSNTPNDTVAFTSTLGANLAGARKWWGGVLSPDGKIYCIPFDAQDVLIIDPVNNTATRNTSILGFMTSSDRARTGKWRGGVLGPDGKIYCPPFNETNKRILVIDPASNTGQYFPVSPSAFSSFYTFNGGVLGPDGRIYCPKNRVSSTSFDIVEHIIIDPVSQQLIPLENDITGSFARGVDNKIYGLNGLATSVRFRIIEPLQPINIATPLEYSNNSFGQRNISTTRNFTENTLGSDGNIYAINSRSSSSLTDFYQGFRIGTVSTEFTNSNQSRWTTTTRSLPGFLVTAKYSGAVAHPTNGKIYHIPYDSDNVLVTNTTNNARTTIPIPTGTGVTNGKWFGGVLGNDGKIYCVPYNATDILIIDPDTDTVTRGLIPGITAANLAGNAKWRRAVLDPVTGKIYCIPFNSNRFLIFQTQGSTPGHGLFVDLLNNNPFLNETSKWSGGVLCYDENSEPVIHCIPFNTTAFLVIKPGSGNNTPGSAGLAGGGPVDAGKWDGGVLGPNNLIYGIPHNATNILVIDPISNTRNYVNGGVDMSGNSKWSGGVLGPDGKIYCIPFNSRDFLIISPNTRAMFNNFFNAQTVGALYTTAIRNAIEMESKLISIGSIFATEKWSDGCLGNNGRIYCNPYNNDTLLEVDIVGNTAYGNQTYLRSTLSHTVAPNNSVIASLTPKIYNNIGALYPRGTFPHFSYLKYPGVMNNLQPGMPNFGSVVDIIKNNDNRGEEQNFIQGKYRESAFYGRQNTVISPYLQPTFDNKGWAIRKDEEGSAKGVGIVNSYIRIKRGLYLCTITWPEIETNSTSKSGTIRFRVSELIRTQNVPFVRNLVSPNIQLPSNPVPLPSNDFSIGVPRAGQIPQFSFPFITLQGNSPGLLTGKVLDRNIEFSNQHSLDEVGSSGCISNFFFPSLWAYHHRKSTAFFTRRTNFNGDNPESTSGTPNSWTFPLLIGSDTSSTAFDSEFGYSVICVSANFILSINDEDPGNTSIIPTTWYFKRSSITGSGDATHEHITFSLIKLK